MKSLTEEQAYLLDEYVFIQEEHLSNALFEITVKGQKSTHWCWYFFPNMPGLGTSETAQKFALDLDTYILFLGQSTRFRRNIFTMIVAVDRAYRRDITMNLERILGNNPVDVLKWKSCLTLTWFAYVHSPTLNNDWESEVQSIVVNRSLVYGYCQRTVDEYTGYR